MPEYTEVLACFHTIERWFNAIHSSAEPPLPLKALWSDATHKEQTSAKKVDPTSRASQGLVYRLDSDTPIVRGSRHVQKSPWPNYDGLPLPSLDGLALGSIRATPRTIILDFGALCFQIQLLTHVMAQPYTREQWDYEVAAVSSVDNARGFKVGIAFDLDAYVLAFLTADNIYTPHWYKPDMPLPVYHMDVYDDYTAFLAAVAEAVKVAHSEGFQHQTALATHSFRQRSIYGNIFGGVGTYTIVELFFVAGLSVFLTTGEVLVSPSRLARLCEAFWVFAHHAHAEIRDFLEPAYVGYILAPTEDQRLSFSHRLHVHGKRRVYMPSRMKELVKAHEELLNKYVGVHPDSEDAATRSDPAKPIDLYDVFEPTYLEAAFRCKDVNLGHLIFGYEEWDMMCGHELGTSRHNASDPLTLMYRSLGHENLPTDTTHLPPGPCKDDNNKTASLTLDVCTHLKLDIYRAELFVPRSTRRASALDVSLYFSDTQTTVWSVTSPFPSGLIPFGRILYKPLSVPKKGRKKEEKDPRPALPEVTADVFYRAATDVRDARTFVSVIKSRAVAIGPLEYCALGLRVVRAGPKGKKNWSLAVCHQSPMLPVHFQQRDTANLLRKKEGRHKSGVRHTASKQASGPGGWQAKPKAQKRRKHKGVPDEGDADHSGFAVPVTTIQDKDNNMLSLDRPHKKRRLSADARLAMSLGNNM